MAEATGKKKVARVAAKKVKDKWKSKQWYTIRAPRMYNGIAISETLSDEPDKLMGRVADVTLQDLTGDISKMHVKLQFKVNGVKGTECVTKFQGHELTSDYIRRLTRRKHSKVDGVFDVLTTDGWTLRVKPLAITEKRAASTQEAEIRRICERIARASAGEKDAADFVKVLVNGELAQGMFQEARKIYPLKRVEIRKSEVLREPEALEPDMDVFAMPATPEEAPVELAPAEEEGAPEAAEEEGAPEAAEEEGAEEPPAPETEAAAEEEMAEELSKGVDVESEELVEEEQIGAEEEEPKEA